MIDDQKMFPFSEMEEGEAELLCYFCGSEFRTRKYFLRHHRAHIDAESCGVPMPEDSWRGMVNSESSAEEGKSVLGTPQPEKEKQMKKNNELKYVTS